MEFIITNWEWILLGFYVCEKVVKVTPTKYDDIVLDIVWSSIKKIAGKK